MPETTALGPPPLAFTPADAERSWESWRCNCGPTALAACLGWTLDRVRPHLGDFESRGYMAPTAMQAAIEATGHLWHYGRPAGHWPVHGLARIQWHGPWTRPGVPPRVAYRYTHWVAAKRTPKDGTLWIYDVNAPGWEPIESWDRETAPRIVAAIPKAEDRWSLSQVYEVRVRKEPSRA